MLGVPVEAYTESINTHRHNHMCYLPKGLFLQEYLKKLNP